MRGMTSSDGKITGNIQSVGSYEKHKKQLAKPTGGESGGVHDAEGHDELKHVVGEHGPAKKVIHSKSTGGIHSESHHEDGYVHHADHDDLDGAHAHGKVAMEDAEHNPMGEDAMEDSGDREFAEKPAKSRMPSFMA